MKVALALDAHGGLSRHFGQSAQFMVYEIDEGKQVGQQARDNPHKGQGHGHGQGREHEHGREQGSGRGQGFGHGGHGWVRDALGDCDVVIAGGIGDGAKQALRAGGVRLIVVEERMSPDRVLELFTEGKL